MPIDANEVAEAERQLAAVHDDWIDRHGVVALEVARRWEDDQPTDEACIRVTVERLLEPDDVPAGELFPRYLGPIRVQVRQGRAPLPQ